MNILSDVSRATTSRFINSYDANTPFTVTCTQTKGKAIYSGTEGLYRFVGFLLSHLDVLLSYLDL